MVRDLLENNGGCKLPCWWGIVPGKTDWSSAKQCLSQFTTVGEGQKHWFSEYSGIMQYTMWSAYQYRLGSLTGGGGIMVKNGGIQRLLITTGTSAYRLSQLLKEYGKPTEIYIRTFRDTPTGDLLPFHLVLDYPEFGTTAFYETTALRLGNGFLRGCIVDEEPILYLRPVSEILTYQEVVEMVFGKDPTLPKTIQEANDIDIVGFFDTVLAKGQICLDTPMELWP